MSLTVDLAKEAEDRYKRELDRYIKLVDKVHSICQQLVNDYGIPATVQSRAKQPYSLYGKLIRYIELNDSEKIGAMNDVESVLSTVGDLAGVRIATYVEADKGRIVDILQSKFVVEHVEEKNKTSGYRAAHCQVKLRENLPLPQDLENIIDTSCEIQVCSMLAHVWNEIEHDLRYKLVGVKDVSTLETTLLQIFHQKTKDADKIIEDLLEERSQRIAATMIEETAAYFPDAARFKINAEEALTCAVRLGYDSAQRLKERLLNEGYVEDSIETLEGINRRLEDNGMNSDKLNPETADVLLALVLKYEAATVKAIYNREIEGKNERRVARIAAILHD